ncbi:MAG: hypothetical protein HC871_11640, partial [Rhizobiales bacterium]|nr:hypothetical protein [Hyphomicrobiales bacterium]
MMSGAWPPPAGGILVERDARAGVFALAGRARLRPLPDRGGAGIGKYKARRREAEGKISSTEQNLRTLEETLARELPPVPETPITLEPSTALQPEVALLAPLEETGEPRLEREEVVEPRVGGVELPVFGTEPAVLHEPEHLAADEPDVQPKPVRETDLDPEAPEPGLLVRREPTPIRIGFEEDDESWRQVVQPGVGNFTARPWVPALLAALAIACLVGLVLLLRPTTTTNPATVTPLEVPGDPVAGSVVNFKLSPDTGLQGRLVVLSTPEAAQLEVNSVLATVP